jgi:hypothetical protein
LFLRIKTTLNGRRFDSNDAIQAAVTTALKKVPVEASEGVPSMGEFVEKMRRCT